MHSASTRFCFESLWNASHLRLPLQVQCLALVRKHQPCALQSEVINQINKYLGLTTLQSLLSSPTSHQDLHCSKATGVQQPISETSNCKRSLFKTVYWPFCIRTNTDLIQLAPVWLLKLHWMNKDSCPEGLQRMKMLNVCTVLFLLWKMQ